MLLIRTDTDRPGRTRFALIGCALATVTALGWAALPGRHAVAGTVLITPAEAQLPSPPNAFADWRGITRAPRIELVEPSKDGSDARSPLHMQIRFRSFGGSEIDFSSLRVTYVKSPPVDLTDRVKPFIKTNLIDIPDAEIPPGRNLIEVRVQDTDGRSGAAVFEVRVAE